MAFTREVGRAKMYSLNMKNEVVKKLIELDRAISDFTASRLDKQTVELENVSEKRSSIPICLL